MQQPKVDVARAKASATLEAGGDTYQPPRCRLPEKESQWQAGPVLCMAIFFALLLPDPLAQLEGSPPHWLGTLF